MASRFVGSNSEHVDLQLPVTVLDRPQIQGNCRQLIHNRNGQPCLCQVDALQVGVAGVANVHADVADFRRGLKCHLRLSFFSARRTINSSKSPLVRAEHTDQRLFRAVTLTS